MKSLEVLIRDVHTWPSALLWSRRVRQVMFSAGMEGAFSFKMRAFVLAGLATTSTYTGAEEPINWRTGSVRSAEASDTRRSLVTDQHLARTWMHPLHFSQPAQSCLSQHLTAVTCMGGTGMHASDMHGVGLGATVQCGASMPRGGEIDLNLHLYQHHRTPDATLEAHVWASYQSQDPLTCLHACGSILLQGGRLALVDADVLGHHVLPLHASLTGETSHHHSDRNILCCNIDVCGCDNACMQCSYSGRIFSFSQHCRHWYSLCSARHTQCFLLRTGDCQELSLHLRMFPENPTDPVICQVLGEAMGDHVAWQDSMHVCILRGGCCSLLTYQEGQGSVNELHLDSFQGLSSWWNVQQVQDHWLVGTQHGPPRHLRCKGIAYLACKQSTMKFTEMHRHASCYFEAVHMFAQGDT